jgi:protein involved in polysaccharide export with SLBB domain
MMFRRRISTSIQRPSSCAIASFADRQGGLCFKSAVLICSLLAGCKTPIYTTRSLPIEYQAPLVSPHADVDLESASANNSSCPRIYAGDLLAISISPNDASKPAEPSTVRVATDGTVMLPRIGEVKIGGLDAEIARVRIANAAIEKGVCSQPKVDLAITMRGTCHVNVTGAVVRPGVIELPNGSNDLTTAVRNAGGLSDNAGTRVEIIHRSENTKIANTSRPVPDRHTNSDVKLASLTEETLPEPASPPEKTQLDLRAIGLGANNSGQLEDGDTVTVAQQEKRTFRIEGLVNSPADIELKLAEDTHVLDAVDLAGANPAQLADLVFVIRQLPKMEEPIIISVSLARAKHDEGENLRITEGDIVLVRRTMRNILGSAAGSIFHASSGR